MKPEPERMRIPIVFSTDHNFVMPTSVTIHSLLSTASNGTEFDINIIVDPDVTEEDRAILTSQVKKDSDKASINFVEIGETFREGYEIRDISKACYNRLMIPWLLPQYDKIIYSDVDIIFKNDISEVFLKDMDQILVAGYGGEVWKKGLIKKYLERIGAESKEYINSGFLVINSKLQRERNLKDEYLKLSKENFLYQDQDIINLVCKGAISHISPLYNLKPSDIYKYKASEIKAIHFIGLKPWQAFTYAWCDWWTSYRESVAYQPEFEKKISSKILKWNNILKNMKKTGTQKIKFYRHVLLK